MTAAQIANTDRSADPPSTGVAAVGSRPDLQLEVLREMLLTMETLTESGQRYTMAKIVAFIESRISSSGPRPSARNEAAVGRIVEQLRCESLGFVVDGERFGSLARTLFDLLEALAPRRDGQGGRPSHRPLERRHRAVSPELCVNDR